MSLQFVLSQISSLQLAINLCAGFHLPCSEHKLSAALPQSEANDFSPTFPPTFRRLFADYLPTFADSSPLFADFSPTFHRLFADFSPTFRRRRISIGGGHKLYSSAVALSRGVKGRLLHHCTCIEILSLGT
jgi:hypothetical protein